MMLYESMIQVLQSGGNLTIDLNKQILIYQVMIGLAQTASSAGTHVTFKNCDGKLIHQTYIAVAQAGRGHVTFEL